MACNVYIQFHHCSIRTTRGQIAPFPSVLLSAPRTATHTGYTAEWPERQWTPWEVANGVDQIYPMKNFNEEHGFPIRTFGERVLQVECLAYVKTMRRESDYSFLEKLQEYQRGCCGEDGWEWKEG